jgi:hypothetical protein
MTNKQLDRAIELITDLLLVLDQPTTKQRQDELYEELKQLNKDIKETNK